MKVSVIIPTLNEAQNIAVQLKRFFAFPDQDLLAEVIIVDGGSEDGTRELAAKAGAKVYGTSQKSRAIQMNHGARLATGSILYFVHADVRPPESCLVDIVRTLDKKYDIGCFAYYFDTDAKLLQLNAFLTGFDWIAAGGGDQGLFLEKELFWDLGGFDEELPIMEDFDFVWRAKRLKHKVKLVNNRAIVSARKYERNNYFKVQFVNTVTFLAFRWGYNPHKLARWYRKMLS